MQLQLSVLANTPAAAPHSVAMLIRVQLGHELGHDGITGDWKHIKLGHEGTSYTITGDWKYITQLQSSVLAEHTCRRHSQRLPLRPLHSAGPAEWADFQSSREGVRVPGARSLCVRALLLLRRPAGDPTAMHLLLVRSLHPAHRRCVSQDAVSIPCSKAHCSRYQGY